MEIDRMELVFKTVANEKKAVGTNYLWNISHEGILLATSFKGQRVKYYHSGHTVFIRCLYLDPRLQQMFTQWWLFGSALCIPLFDLSSWSSPTWLRVVPVSLC
jgi:hypothetical protein